jgi:hypothetical protein
MLTRESALLVRARRQGYFDARRAGAQHLLRPYALWCWRLKLPVIWLEKRAPCSRYATLHLDLFTTDQMLTPQGQSELAALSACRAVVSAHDASWDRIPRKDAAGMAHAVLRAAIRSGNHEPNRVRRGTKILQIVTAAA